MKRYKLMKKGVMLVIIFSFFFIHTSIEAASSQLVWNNYGSDNLVEEVVIQNGNTYSVPFGVEGDATINSSLASAAAEGYLYLINPETLSRELVAHIGGFGDNKLTWDKDGHYELDVYEFSIFPARKSIWQNLFAWLIPKKVYAQSDELFLETISFDIVEKSAVINPVIIVPGIMGTKLLDKKIILDNVIWPNFANIALSRTDDFLDVLGMDPEGLPLDADIITGDLLKKVSDADYWEGLFSTLGANGHGENDLIVFTYDWRVDVSKTVLDLKNKIDQIRSQTGTDKVDIIAHSMGGIIVKKYLNDYGGESVGKFIDISTPHFGAPKAFKILSFGDDMGFPPLGVSILNLKEVYKISQNMPAIYQLLPSRNYFDDSDNNYKYYVFNSVNFTDRLTFDQTKNYLKSEGRNSALVDRADEFHQEIDNLNPADYGVKTYNIVGCGTPTLGQFYIFDNTDNHYIYNIKMINGDGTVPLKSAEAIPAIKTYYVKNAVHALMPSTSGVKELVAGILADEENFDINPYSNLALTTNDCQIPNGKIVSFHSPIELHIYDQSGNHTGPDANGDIENNISGVVYEVINDNKFAFLPDGIEYDIKGNATDAGTFDVRIQELVNGEVSTTTIFADIPLTLTTHTEFALGSTTPKQIALDNDGDGVFESSKGISTTTAGILTSTGKIKATPTQIETVSNSSLGSSKGPFVPTHKANEVVATSSTILISTTPLLPKVIKEKVALSKPVVAVTYNEAITTTQDNKYENSAIVYKSWGYKITSFFNMIWSWIISRL